MENFITLATDFECSRKDTFCVAACEVINGEIGEVKTWDWTPESSGIYDYDTHREMWKNISEYLNGKTVLCFNTGVTISSIRLSLEYHNLHFPEIYFYSIGCLVLEYIGYDAYPQRRAFRYLGYDISNFDPAYLKVRPLAELAVKALTVYGGNLSDLDSKNGFIQGYMGYDKYEVLTPSFTHSQMLKYLREEVEVDENNFNPNFKGKKVCFTGALGEVASRNNLFALIHQMGGIPTNSVSSKTDILVVGNNGDYISSKLLKAKALQEANNPIEIIDEKEFILRMAG